MGVSSIGRVWKIAEVNQCCKLGLAGPLQIDFRGASSNLGVNPARSGRISHTINGQHVSGDPRVDAMAIGVRSNGIKAIHHNFFQAIIDGFEIPEVALSILNPFKVG